MKSDSRKKRKPVSKGGKNGEDGTHSQYIVKMSYNVVSVVKNNIKRGIRKNNSS